MVELTFKPTNTVVASSIPGPVMIVQGVKGDYVDCYWFDSNNHKCEDRFLAATLKHYDERNYDTNPVDDDDDGRDFMTA